VHLCAGQFTDIAQPVNWHLSQDAFISSQDIERQLNVLIKRCTVREKLGTGLGKALQTTLNTGVTALFYGASGAGKTLAASIVASQLATPLYRIDLAGLMNKYIGETEKNLSKALDQAAESDVILLLDEADALFGKRNDGSNSGDRFANMLTNYLLTRIETHPGVVILTSNAKERIDSAFTRRLDVMVEFRLPNAKQRYQLWCHHFGSRIPSHSFCQFLGDYCELSGGFIRNIVLNAAAIDAGIKGDAIDECVVLECVIDEYLKLGRALPSEIALYYKRLKAASKGDNCASLE
jgi:SpoVK/Ycf46/Vps4 family AAA+-type ATPase